MADSGPEIAATPLPSDDAPGPSLARATALMSVGTALSRTTGFIRLAVMAWAIGGVESKLPDTYNLANSLPNIVYQLVLGEILATVFVPVFVEHLKTKAREESWRLASTILNSAFVVAAIFALLTVVASPWLIKIYTFRVADDALRMQMEEAGAFFMRVFMPQMIFYATGAVLTGLLNAHRRFGPPMFAPILNNLIVIATFVAFRLVHGNQTPVLSKLATGEKWILAGGTTLGVVVFTMVLWPFVRRLPGRYDVRAFDWKHPAVRHVGTLAKYSFAYVIVNQAGLWVIYMLANSVQGGISAYQASFILYQLPYGIFAVSVMTALIPTLAERYVHRDDAGFRRELSIGLRTTAFVVLPAAAGFVALGRPIIRLLLEHGVFKGESTALYADTFVMMAIGLGAYAAFQQIMRAFYARQDTKTPLVVNVVAVAINTALNIPLYQAMGVPGLALGHTISYFFAVAHGGFLLRKRLGGIDGGRLLSSHLRIGLASVATAGLSWLVARLLERTMGAETFAEQFLQVAGAVTAGLILYAALAAALRLDEFRPLVRAISGRFGRRNRSPEES